MNMTRRYFLKTTGALALYTGISPLNLLGESGIDPNQLKAVKKGRTLVVIFLRGGVDGLNLVVPFGDSAYYDLRRSLAISKPGTNDESALDLDGMFGLHPRASALMPLFQSGAARALHAVGYAHNTRSHFEEQDVWETGVIGNTVHSDGWLNRHLLTSTGHGPVRAVSLGDTLPRILRGDAPAFALRGITDLSMPGKENEGAAMVAALEHAYCTDPREHTSAALDLLASSAQVTLDGMQQIQSAMQRTPESSVAYPDTGIGRQLKEVARLIKSEVGMEVAEIDYGGWDTHNNQGGVGGAFGNLVQDLSDAIAAFNKDMANKMDDVLVLTLSDFGRTAAENGTQGTDHGWANCMLAIGGGVGKNTEGGARPVHTKWPGLAKEQLHQGRDLMHTIDFRDVLAEVVQNHLGNTDLQKILPGYEFQPVGLV